MLLIVHNVTSVTRLLDVLPLFRDDLRVQLLATCTGSSPFQSGVCELLTRVGVPVLPWDQALHTPVNLALAASFGGEIHDIQGDLVIISHGMGYNKRLRRPETGDRRPETGDRRPETGDRRPETGDRRPETGDRRPETGDRRPVFGLSPEWLLADGTPVADVLVLSHPEQIERLRNACPEAVPTAVLAGDPCFDRMLAARPYRERFRRALGVKRGQRLVLLNSTWNPESLFGDGGDEDVLPLLLPKLTAELAADEHRIAAVLHPNIWHGHGPGQIRSWLDRAQRGGLTLVDPLEGWQQALLSADVVLGDFGSVSYYAAALGTPVLLGAAPLAGLAADSPVADFVRKAPRLDPHAPLRPQLEALLATHQPMSGPAEFTTSAPGEAAARLRRIFYDVMGIPEPAAPALLDPLPLPSYDPPMRTSPLRVLTSVLGATEVSVTRYADPRHEPQGPGEAHTAVHEDTLDPGLLSIGDVIFRYGSPDDPRLGPPEYWTAEVLERHPGCALAAYVTAAGGCVVRTRGGALLRLAADSQAADPAAYASALHAWLALGKDLAGLAGGLTVWTGQTAHHVSVTQAGPGPLTHSDHAGPEGA
ncbi:hypothetical protein GCM10020295_37920 [Streptomyces cinereospinus]